eukprot:COSAG06_NODE_43115_length_375_cov_0.630435_1_plen_46_part_10
MSGNRIAVMNVIVIMTIASVSSPPAERRDFVLNVSYVCPEPVWVTD